MACGMKHEEIAKILITTGKCKIEAVDAKGRTALLAASGAGIVDTVKLLLKNKADIKSSDNNGSIPLIVACFAGQLEVVRCLLAFNSEPRWKNKQGINALGAAIVTHKESGGRLDVMRELLRYCKKKDISIVESRNSSTQWTPLIVAAYKGYADVVELLLEYGADLSAKGKKGFTALIAASQNGWIEVVRVLLKHGADVHLALEDGSTAIVAASAGGYQDIVRILAEHDKSCLEVRFKNGSTPLMTACLSGYVTVVQVLLAQGAAVNVLNDDHWSALTVAAQKGCFQITKELLAHGAEFDTCSDKGFTPLMYAIQGGFFEVAEELIRSGAKVNHFTLSADGETLTKAEIPLVYGYMTPLMLAINQGDTRFVELILNSGADLYLDLALLMVHSKQPKDKYTPTELEELKKQIRLAEEKEKVLKENSSKEPSARNIAVAKDASEEVDRAHQRLETFVDDQEAQEQTQQEATFVYTFFSRPLLFAVYWNNAEMVKMLLQCELALARKVQENESTAQDLCPPIIELENAQDMNALQLAADYFYGDMVLLLMRHHAFFSFAKDKVCTNNL
eukprot:gene15869-18130_t